MATLSKDEQRHLSAVESGRLRPKGSNMHTIDEVIKRFEDDKEVSLQLQIIAWNQKQIDYMATAEKNQVRQWILLTKE